MLRKSRISSEKDKGALAEYEVCCESFPKILKEKRRKRVEGNLKVEEER